jgi:hypothetical protein
MVKTKGRTYYLDTTTGPDSELLERHTKLDTKKAQFGAFSHFPYSLLAGS